jgi:hypothetical protein
VGCHVGQPSWIYQCRKCFPINIQRPLSWAVRQENTIYLTIIASIEPSDLLTNPFLLWRFSRGFGVDEILFHWQSPHELSLLQTRNHQASKRSQSRSHPIHKKLIAPRTQCIFTSPDNSGKLTWHFPIEITSDVNTNPTLRCCSWEALQPGSTLSIKNSYMYTLKYIPDDHFHPYI